MAAQCGDIMRKNLEGASACVQNLVGHLRRQIYRSNFRWLINPSLPFHHSAANRKSVGSSTIATEDFSHYVNFNTNAPTKKKLDKEVELGRMASSFPETTLPNLRIFPSQFGSQEDGYILTFQHLSFPLGGPVNDDFKWQELVVTYVPFDKAPHLVEQAICGVLLQSYTLSRSSTCPFRLLLPAWLLLCSSVVASLQKGSLDIGQECSSSSCQRGRHLASGV